MTDETKKDQLINLIFGAAVTGDHSGSIDWWQKYIWSEWWLVRPNFIRVLPDDKGDEL